MTAGHSTAAGVKSISGLDATNSNLLNFAAVEDLGGGLKATANIGLRFDVNQAATQNAFGKATGDQYADLTSAKFGGVRVGTFTSYSDAGYSAFATWTNFAVASGLSATSINSLAYTSPDISGFKAKLTSFVPFVEFLAATDAVAGTGKANDITAHGGQQVILTYTNGPFAAGYMNQEYSVIGDGTGVKLSTLNANYDFGMVKVFVQTWDQKGTAAGNSAGTSTTTATLTANQKLADNKGYGISANIPYQAWTLKVGMRKFSDSTIVKLNTDRTTLGLTYSLSKRTTVIALLAKDKTINTAATKTNNTYLGVQHAF